MAELISILSERLPNVPGFQLSQEPQEYESLMARFRTKANKETKVFKSWIELTKALRLAVTDKRNFLDVTERVNLQKCLDISQKPVKVTSLQSMVERLDSIARQQGLKFARLSSTHCCISSDIFCVEVLLEHSGVVNDVKIAHSEAPVSCPELTKVLRAGCFSEFTKHLEGLSAIYQLNADSANPLDSEAQKLKKKAYAALYYLEHDLSQLWQLQRSIKESSNLVHKSPVGILQERQGGYPLRLTYFVSPYDLLDLKTKSSIALTVDAVVEKGLGRSVTVGIESSNTHKLQSASLITVSNNGEKSLPSNAAHSNLNSTELPASFVLKLQEPVPMAVSILKKIQGVTKISNSVDLSNSQSLLYVIINDTSKGKIPSSSHKKLFVALPDQQHCYTMKSNPDLQGVLVSSIPFTHPAHVPQILDFLRQQMLFNTVISSCVRPKSKKDIESALKFDIHAYSTNHIQVTFVHPLDESLATVDLDLKKITGVKCEIHTLGMDNSLCTDDYASKIMQRCLSIPVTMRAVIRKAQGQQQQKKPEPNDLYCTSVGGGTDVSYLPHMPNYNSRLSNGSSLAGGHFSNLASRMCNKPMDDLDLVSSKTCPENVPYGLLKCEPNSEVLSACSVDPHGIASAADRLVDTQVEKMLNENKSASLPSFLLQNENCNESSKTANPMLLSMLNDVPSAAPSSSALGLPTKPRKRKASDGRGYGVGKSPKRKMSEESGSNRDFDGSSSDSASAGIDKSLSLSASLSSSDTESCHVARGPASVEPYVKNDLPLAYPQRSASTDSYLSFRSQHVLSNSENSNPELPNISSQIKNSSHFASDNSDQLGSDSNLDLDSESFSEKSSFAEKAALSDKGSKKSKKIKDVSDNPEIVLSKNQDMEGSEGSSSSDFFHKSFDADSNLSEDSKVPNFMNVSKPVVISTNLKIAKTTDGHKVSKSESKMKQKEGRRSGESSSGKKKSDGKKERKRKQIQTSDGSSSQMSCHPVQCADASLMPPPTSSSAELSSGSVCDTQPKRPITLNVKTSSSPSQSKSLVAVGTSSHSASISPKGSFSKTSPDKTGVKLSRVSQSLAMGKTVNSLRDNELSSVTKAVIGNASLKLPTKHKQSSSTKSSSGVSHSSGQSSPNKSKPTTLKLKNSSLSHTPSSSASSTKSSPQTHSSQTSSSVSPSLMDDPPSPGKSGSCSSSKSHKSQLRSGKSSLSAVIDKLRVTATNAQQLPENVRPNSETVDKKESKLERKEGVKDGKEGQQGKPTEGKNKYCSSDQFTVKQSSQGIKLTVTKTRFSDGSKSTKLKPSSGKPDSSGANPNKSSGGIVTKRPTGTSQVSVKKPHVASVNLHPNSSHKTVRCTSTTSTTPTKSAVVAGHKVISPSGTSYHKVMSSSVKGLKPNKVSSIIQQNKKKIPHLNESKCATVNDIAGKSASNALNLPAKMVTTLSAAKLSQNATTWAVSNVLKQGEESFDASKFSSHIDVIEEADRETAFKLLIEQSKNEGQNGSEQAQPTSKSIEFAVQPVTDSKMEGDNKEFTVTSSTDSKKSPNVFRLNQVSGSTSDLITPLGMESKPIVSHSDITSIKKHEINASLVNSEQMGKNLTAFNLTSKPSDCLNMRSEESSPDDGLIIDYPGTPRMQDQKRNYQGKKKDISPDQKKGRIDSIMVDKINENFEYQQSSFITKPLEQLSPSTSNHSHTLPVEPWPLDDDLMNMALTMGK